jgi:septum formation topological specificity factor MinE
MVHWNYGRRGWRPNPLKILRKDVNKYIESDKDIINLSLKIDYHMQIANYLEDIIKQINNRNFMIRAAIDWVKFQSGG